MGEMRNTFRILIGRLKGRDHLEDLDVDARMLWMWISKRQGGIHMAQEVSSGRFLC
jgi:hypothetical protein